MLMTSNAGLFGILETMPVDIWEENPNSKHQIPSKFKSRSINDQNKFILMVKTGCFEFWFLVIEIYLLFEIWDLYFQADRYLL